MTHEPRVGDREMLERWLRHPEPPPRRTSTAWFDFLYLQRFHYIEHTPGLGWHATAKGERLLKRGSYRSRDGKGGYVDA